MDDAEDDFEAWTAEGAQRLTDAAAALTAALRTHATAITSARADRDIKRVFAAGEALLPVVLAYADAQFDFTGNAFPFGPLHQFADDDEDDDAEEGGEEFEGRGVSVLSRADYIVTNETALIAAGREAYLRVWPDDTPAQAEADVTHLGRALYQIAHSDGWHSLGKVEGLEPTGGIVVVHDQDEPLQGTPDDWPEAPFAADGEQLYQQCDIYGPPPG